MKFRGMEEYIQVVSLIDSSQIKDLNIIDDSASVSVKSKHNASFSSIFASCCFSFVLSCDLWWYDWC